ncbi:MAG: chorismate lyase [Pseudomonadales bacterium]|nr:chorismate lyase [Pseudomonadales bacterium]
MYVHYHSGFQPESPRWKDHQQLQQADLPYRQRSWLLDSGSLSARLVRASNNHFRVHVLSQSWQSARLDEYRLLGIEPKELCLIREVLLLCHEQPWVYARSVLPVTSLVGKLRHLRQFGTQPLGQLLFNTPGMRRNPFEVAQIGRAQLPAAARPVDHDQLQPNTQSEPTWGRRSRFTLYDRPLMVSEIFLPAFCP